jgi:hypothetical protein
MSVIVSPLALLFVAVLASTTLVVLAVRLARSQGWSGG